MNVYLADAVLTSLMDDQAVSDVVGGQDGILAGLKRGGIHIGTSSKRRGECA
jgi:3-hydroxyisobutyrate dehydrogenase-like beta-hydroxyacid dehydrogenase